MAQRCGALEAGDLHVSTFQAVYYRDPSAHEPMREFIDGLGEDIQAALENQIDPLNLLSDAMPHLPFPHSSQVDGQLRELRCHFGRQHYRVLYRRSGRLLVLLHVFSKRTAKIDPRDIAVARERWDDFKARMNAKPRVRPRAAGHDAS